MTSYTSGFPNVKFCTPCKVYEPPVGRLVAKEGALGYLYPLFPSKNWFRMNFCAIYKSSILLDKSKLKIWNCTTMHNLGTRQCKWVPLYLTPKPQILEEIFVTIKIVALVVLYGPTKSQEPLKIIHLINFKVTKQNDYFRNLLIMRDIFEGEQVFKRIESKTILIFLFITSGFNIQKNFATH
jgi:hypothetical protein